MNHKITDQSASIILSAMSFLLVTSFLLASFSFIIKNESRQTLLLKDNYTAKAMIRQSHYFIENNYLSEKTFYFNHGQVEVELEDTESVSYTATLNNAYQLKQNFKMNSLDETKNEEFIDRIKEGEESKPLTDKEDKKPDESDE